MVIPKFRCWHRDRREWLSPVNCWIDLNGTLFWQSAYKEPEPIHKDEYVLMQSTGLKDKNGREIFEGDLVKAKIYRDPEEVVFRDGAFRIGRTGATLYEATFLCEVVGNVWEHPHLMRGGRDA